MGLRREGVLLGREGGESGGSSSSMASTPIMAAFPGALLPVKGEKEEWEEEETPGCMVRTTGDPPAPSEAGRLARLRRPIGEPRGAGRKEWLAGPEKLSPPPANKDSCPAR